MLQIPELEIDVEKPFANDYLERKGAILKLSGLVVKIDEPLTLAVNARWGSGKSTFIKMWQAHLRKEGVHALHLNSWETDFSQDPLIPILDVMAKYLKDQKTWEGDKQLIEDFTSFAKVYVKHAAVFGAKFATLGAFEGDELAQAAAETAGNIVSDAFDSFNQAKDAVEKISTTLQRLVADKGKNIVIFIDELDRCRPTYAIELLERVKHLFQAKRVVFVISLDKEQLSHSVKSVYGSEFDSENYLDRFFDVTFDLPDVEATAYTKYLASVDTFESEKENELFSLLLSLVDLSLRQVNRLIYRLKLSKTFITENDGSDFFLAVMVFSFLRNCHPKAYVDYFKSNQAIDQTNVSLFSGRDINFRQCTVIAILVRGWYASHRLQSQKKAPYLDQLFSAATQYNNKGGRHNSREHYASETIKLVHSLELGNPDEPIGDRVIDIVEFTDSVVKQEENIMP